MANKFQRGVLERLEQEATRNKNENKTKPAPSKTKNNQSPENIETKPNPRAKLSSPKETTEPIPIKEPEPQLEQETIPTEPKQAPPTHQPLADVSDYLQREPTRQAKNKTFYLDGDVIKAIKATAKAQGVTDSKLVNDILKRVLLVN